MSFLMMRLHLSAREEGDGKTISPQLCILTVFLQHAKVKSSLDLQAVGEVSYV